MSKAGTTNIVHPSRGSVFEDDEGYVVKVMAIADNWALVRRSHRKPYCVLANDLMTKYRLIHPEPKQPT